MIDGATNYDLVGSRHALESVLLETGEQQTETGPTGKKLHGRLGARTGDPREYRGSRSVCHCRLAREYGDQPISDVEGPGLIAFGREDTAGLGFGRAIADHLCARSGVKPDREGRSSKHASCVSAVTGCAYQQHIPGTQSVRPNTAFGKKLKGHSSGGESLRACDGGRQVTEHRRSHAKDIGQTSTIEGWRAGQPFGNRGRCRLVFFTPWWLPKTLEHERRRIRHAEKHASIPAK